MILFNEIMINRISGEVNNCFGKNYDVRVRIAVYIIMCIGMLGCILNCKYAGCIMIYYGIWLMQLAYVDYYTGFVYDCMVYSGIPIVIAALLYICINYREAVIPIMVAVMCTIIPLIIAGIIGCIGGGDEEVMVIGAVLNTLWFVENGYMNTFEILLQNYIVIYIGILVFVIRYCRCIEWRRCRLKKAYPFLPSVFMADVITMFFYL